MNHKIAFNTANLVARVTGHHFLLKDWGEQHRKTIEQTDESEWNLICGEIAAAGYTAVEIWQAHADPSLMTPSRCATWKRILSDHGLTPIGYAGQYTPTAVEICNHLGIDSINGSPGVQSPAEATTLAAGSGVRFNIENHPEKTAAELLAKIDGGNEWLGVCIDTGWLGTQGVNEPEFIRACGSLIRHVHVKDVRQTGGHDTCLLGEGVVDLTSVLQALRTHSYDGWYSWEDEPEDRNPMESAVKNRQWLENAVR